MSMALFDRVVMVDWSANSTPKRGRDSIWLADSATGEAINPPTRFTAMDIVRSITADTTSDRLLIGFDFSFGYPMGFASALNGNPDAGWADVWSWLADSVSDDDRNRNDRLDIASAVNRRLGSGPFWGYPGKARSDSLPRTRPASYAPFDEFRIAEHRVRAAGHRPFSSWQLAYPGSVGSQMMLGMRCLELLRRDALIGPRLRIWPFETGIGADSAVVEHGQVLIAEIWPSMFPIDADRHPIRDAAQVLTMVDHIMGLDTAGELSTWFEPRLSADERRVVLSEEGWTLGVL